MKQPKMHLKEKNGEDLGVFPVFLVEWRSNGEIFKVVVKFPSTKRTPMYLSDDKKTFDNGYGNMIGTLIDEESPE